MLVLCSKFLYFDYRLLFAIVLQQMMRESWALEVMKTVNTAYTKKNKRLEDLKNKLEISEAENTKLASELQTAQGNECQTKQANSTLVLECAEIHSQYLKFKKSSKYFENELKAEKLGRAKDIAKLIEDCIDMISKGYNKCKYNLFKEYREKKSGS